MPKSAQKRAESKRGRSHFRFNQRSRPFSFGAHLREIRKHDGITLDAFASLLGISRGHLSEVELGRKSVSPERAVKWAKLLGHSEARFLQLALQAALDDAGLRYTLQLSARRKKK